MPATAPRPGPKGDAGGALGFEYIRSSILVEFRNLALALRLDPLALMAEAGIGQRFLDDRDLMVPMEAIVTLYEVSARISGMSDFGIRLAEARGLPDLGTVMLMLRKEPNVGAAVTTLTHILHYHSSAVYLFLEEAAENPIVVVNIIGRRIGQCRQAMETSVACITSILRWMLGETWRPLSVSFTHAALGCTARHRRFFGCPIDFQQDVNSISLSAADLKRPLPPDMPLPRQSQGRSRRDPYLSERELNVYRITKLITMNLADGRSSASGLARHLGITVRTLNRHLSQAGTSYSAVQDAVRRRCVIQYLMETDRPASDIAGLVGFSSLSAFSRWFNGAFGSAPSVWRSGRLSRAVAPQPKALARSDRTSSFPALTPGNGTA